MNCPTNEDLERLALGFLEDEVPVRQHAESCAECAARLKALGGEHEALTRAAKAVRLPKLEQPKPSGKRLWVGISAIAACALVGIVVMVVSQQSESPMFARSVHRRFSNPPRDSAARETIPSGNPSQSLQWRPPSIRPDQSADIRQRDLPYDSLEVRLEGRRDPFDKQLLTDATGRVRWDRTLSYYSRADASPRPAQPAPSPKPPIRRDEPRDEPPAGMQFKDHGINPTVNTAKEPTSTFALDVDTASYTMIRNYLKQGQLPPRAAVRVEECVNYFRYADRPADDKDFLLRLEVAPSPFHEDRHLLRIAVLAREIAPKDRKDVRLTFVIDVSGSMNRQNRLGLVKRSLQLLVDRLRPTDQVAIVVYGSNARKLLDLTSVSEKVKIQGIIDALRTQGSTNAEAGLRMGYELAAAGFDDEFSNRVVLCSDGVANVGRTGPDDILAQIKKLADKGITLSTLGFGMGNYNDVLMERLADKGNGNYSYVDDFYEAKKVFTEKLTGLLEVVAFDAKIQVEFNPETVATYRLVGYENRHVANRDFRNDKVDAGEIGAGHRVSAIYELALKKEAEGKLVTARLRYRQAGTNEMIEPHESIAVADAAESATKASPSFRLAASVMQFAEILRESPHVRGVKMGRVAEFARPAVDELDRPEAAVEFLMLAGAAARLGK